MNVVVLLAGGSGSRIGADVPKQHIVINKQQIIEYTLTAFSACQQIDAILVASNLEYMSKVNELKALYPKLKWVISGGETRIETVYNCISFLNDICSNSDNIIISDAARPCITISEMKELLNSLTIYNAATTGIECYETIFKVENDELSSIIPRDGTIRQTSPEGYKFFVLKDLYLNRDSSILCSYKNIGIDQLHVAGEKVAIVKSNPLNFKITTKEDIYLFETVLKKGFENIICGIRNGEK